MSKQHMSAATLKFLLAARQSQLQGLEALTSTSVLVGHVSRLVHALQKERGYSTLFLSGPLALLPAELVALRGDAEGIETQARRFLLDLEPAALRCADKTRLLHCISHALHRLDGMPDLRWRVRERKLTAQNAGIRFTQVIACLLSLVFEAADSALDPDVTRALVALFNFMQGKESSGQERALGAMGYKTGYCDQASKAQLSSLAENQRRAFESFVRFADVQALRMWQNMQQSVESVHRLRDILLKTSPDEPVDSGLAELWYEVCTACIDAMRGIEQHLTDTLALRCQECIARAREELGDHQLLLSRFADTANDAAAATVFDIQPRSIEAPLPDGLAHDMELSVLDMLQAQTLHLRRTGGELAQLRGSLDERRLVEQAKWLLVRQQGLSEQAAHDRLLRVAMDRGIALGELARQLLASEDAA